MNFSNDYQSTERLQARLEETEADLGRSQERVALLETEAAALADLIGGVTERLGHKGRDGDDLLDAEGQLTRFLEGRDLELRCSELSGVACQLRRLIDWSHVGSRVLCNLLYTITGVSDGVPESLSPGLSVVLNKPVTPELLYSLTTCERTGTSFEDASELMTIFADMINDRPEAPTNRLH